MTTGVRVRMRLHAVSTCLFLAAGLAAMGCGGPAVERPETPLRSVRTLTVQPTTAGNSRTFTGISRSSLESRLSFKVSGTLQELPIEVGDTLKRGDLVGRLDASLYTLEAQRAEASLVQAQAAERNARAAYNRIKGLYADNNATRNDLDTARANAESAQAQVDAAAKQLELARLNVSYTMLRAATDCTVATVGVEVNENVGVGNTIATVNCGDELKVEMSVPESLIGGVRRDMPATVIFDAIPGVELAAKVSEVGVSSSGSAFPVTVTIEGTHPRMRSGLAAEVRLQFAEPRNLDEHVAGRLAEERFLVPLSSLVKDGEGSFVYVLDAADASGQGTVRRRRVTLGELTEQGVEVLAGLRPGDRVITAGTSVMRDGLVVADSGVDDNAAAGQ